MRSPRDRKGKGGEERPPRGGRALERLRQWQRARGLPERELDEPRRAEEEAERPEDEREGS